MSTKTKIFAKNPKSILKKIKQSLGIYPRESKNQNLKEIHAMGSDIIDATDGRRTDGRTDGRRTNFDFMSSADTVKQS